MNDFRDSDLYMHGYEMDDDRRMYEVNLQEQYEQLQIKKQELEKKKEIHVLSTQTSDN